MAGIYGLMAADFAKQRASEAEKAARKSETASAEVQREMGILEERLEKLVLVSMALWSLIEERTGLTEQDLVERVQKLDLEDGVADGKITRQLRQCPACGRNVSRRHRKCLFCGNEDFEAGAFERL